LGLLGAEEAVDIEAWMARDGEAAGLHARIRAALGPLESLPPEPCPEELLERTVRLLCTAAREPPAPAYTKTTRRRSLDLEDLWSCLSSNILMK
jgi:anti-sigma-K factor RskA